MGLDVYAHRVSKKVADKYGVSIQSGIEEVYNALKKDCRADFKKKTTSYLKTLTKKYDTQSADEYSQSYMEFISKLNNIDNYKKYRWYLNDFGYDEQQDTLVNVKTPSEVKEVLKDHLRFFSPCEDAYFRKVNFIYAYFQNLLVDECCLVDKKAIFNLVNICKEVLKHKDNIEFAKDNLPTTSGFFFGSTEYDEYYYNDVEDCINQMEKLYNSMDDEDFVLWVFSW